jgi:hypothetical protein
VDIKKFVVAIVVAYVILMGSNYLIHTVWLMQWYQASPDSWRPMDQFREKMWVMWLGQLLFSVMFVYIYTRGVENKPWVGQGIRYGILMTLLTVFPYSMAEYVVYRVHHLLAERWMAAGLVQMLVMGLAVAGIMGPKKAST